MTNATLAKHPLTFLQGLSANCRVLSNASEDAECGCAPELEPGITGDCDGFLSVSHGFGAVALVRQYPSQVQQAGRLETPRSEPTCQRKRLLNLSLGLGEMTQLTDLLGEGTEELIQSLTVIVYAAVIVATAIFQGLNARYYFVRTARIRDYVRDTPPWVLDLQRSAVID